MNLWPFRRRETWSYAMERMAETDRKYSDFYRESFVLAMRALHETHREGMEGLAGHPKYLRAYTICDHCQQAIAALGGYPKMPQRGAK